MRRHKHRANRILFITNVVVAVVTIFSYLLPLVNPDAFPILSVLTILIPVFYLLNLLFFIFWLLKKNKLAFLAGIVLLIGSPLMSNFYSLWKQELPRAKDDFTVMSYNVRLFNLFKLLPKENAARDITTFFKNQNPDILCIQEYSASVKLDESQYPHGFILMQGNKIKSGQAIFSKYPIINKGQILFPKSINNIIYADIKLNNGVVRVYNMHFQSVRISPDVNEISENIEALNKANSQIIFLRMSKAFKLQKTQVDMLLSQQKTCKHKIVVCGDLNNTIFSNTYHRVKGDDLIDAFQNAEAGFGATYKFNFFPTRIDYIFADKSIAIKQFATFSDFENSDHFPIMARLNLVN